MPITAECAYATARPGIVKTAHEPTRRRPAAASNLRGSTVPAAHHPRTTAVSDSPPLAVPTAAGAPPPTADGKARSRLLTVVVVVLAAAALKFSRPVTLPLVAGMLIVMLVWPIQRRLERRVPRPLAYTLTFLFVLAVLAAFVSVLLWSARAVVDALPNVQPRLEGLAGQVREWLRQHGLPAPAGSIGSLGAGGDDAGAGAEGGFGASLPERLARVVYESLTLLALTLGFALLGLVEVHGARARVVRNLPQGERIVEIVARIAAAMRRYVAVKTATSAITGAASAAFALAVGLDLAFVWGLIAFLLEYVPTVGSTLAIVPPSLYALLHYGNVGQALGVVAGFTALQLFFGNFVDPKIEGRVMALSPVMVLLSITLWAWIWGAPGALLGVPLTMVIIIVCRQFERTRWVAVLLSEDRRKRPRGARADAAQADGDLPADADDTPPAGEERRRRPRARQR